MAAVGALKTHGPLQTRVGIAMGLVVVGDFTAPNGPGEGDSGWRAAMCCANLGERRITQQRAARSAKRGVGHYWQCVLRTPEQQVMFNGAVTETVGNLISCAAIAMRNI